MAPKHVDPRAVSKGGSELARRRRLVKPVKIAFGASTQGTSRARTTVPAGRPKARRAQAVKKALSRPTRFRLKPIKHSLPLRNN